MSYRQTGSCPKCGAAIYVPLVWMGIFPPPPMHSCQCARKTCICSKRAPTTNWSPDCPVHGCGVDTTHPIAVTDEAL